VSTADARRLGPERPSSKRLDSDRPGSERLDPDRPGSERLASARQIAASIPDPELPMLTLADLGIIRGVSAEEDGVVVSVTPTYSGCPAMAEIRADICHQLTAAGFSGVEVRTVLNPPWSTEWITDAGRRKLAEAGIAPPGAAPRRNAPVPLTLTMPAQRVTCPACGSADTQQTAAFSGTACKDLYRCRACAEPFEHMKEI
jgi:ring-1,2-phenylacetyl-CoA epoxidase subunit PaaD